MIFRPLPGCFRASARMSECPVWAISSCGGQAWPCEQQAVQWCSSKPSSLAHTEHLRLPCPPLLQYVAQPAALSSFNMGTEALLFLSSVFGSSLLSIILGSLRTDRRRRRRILEVSAVYGWLFGIRDQVTVFQGLCLGKMAKHAQHRWFWCIISCAKCHCQHT